MIRFYSDFRQLGRAFALLWVGETTAAFGAGLMQFAVGVWVYRASGSAQQFALAFLAGTLPALLFIPWSATLADRFDRRWVIVGTDLLGAALAIALAVALVNNSLHTEYLYAFAAAGAILGTIRGPSYQAAVSVVLPQHSLTRATGISGLSHGVLQLLVPLVAGALLASSGLRHILIIQLGTMLFGAVAVFLAFSSAKNAFVPARQRPPLTFLRGAIGGLSPGWAFFRREPLMMRLFLYAVVHDGLLVLASTMLTPLILSTHSAAVLGMVGSCGAAGGLAGSLLLVLSNTKRRLMVWSLTFNMCLSLCVLVAGLYSSAWVWSACAFLALLAGSASSGCSLALWIKKTPNEERGSVFSLLALSQLVVASLVMLGGGVIGEQLLEPALAVGGKWEGSVGLWLGVGKGRGIAFLFVVSGVVCTLVSLVALARSGLRRLDELVTDSPAPAAADT